uniref:Uncharacterized protein n=1 Tax=Onchocerca volvulus TaxID=6282 RepID=A0A8R1U1K9_ONCVO
MLMLLLLNEVMEKAECHKRLRSIIYGKCCCLPSWKAEKIWWMEKVEKMERRGGVYDNGDLLKSLKTKIFQTSLHVTQ